MITLDTQHAAYRATAALAATLAKLNAGTTGATVAIYGSARPANGAPPGGPALVTLTLAKPAGTIDAGVLTLAAPDDAMSDITGVAIWARVSANGSVIFDCDVSDVSGTATIRLATTQLYAGGSLHLSSGALG